MHLLEEKIVNAKKAGRYGLVPFLTAGYPNRDAFWDALAELDAGGADIIEIGVPFSDPVADGPVIERASRLVLEDGINLEYILTELARRKGSYRAAIVLMGYLNPFLQYDFAKFAADAAEAGVSGLIVPDLPHEEDEPYRNLLAARGIALIPLVGPNTSEERMRLYAKNAQGYVYIVSVMGTTGERAKITKSIASTMDLARRVFSVPVALGFGLKNPEQLLELPEQSRPDAAVFGSALLTHLDAGKSAREFMAAWHK